MAQCGKIVAAKGKLTGRLTISGHGTSTPQRYGEAGAKKPEESRLSSGQNSSAR
jgi:hypothetical protein